MTTYVVSYTNVDRILTALPQIGSGSTVGSNTILSYAEQAESLINVKLGKLYSLPFTSSVPVLTTIATDLAIYNLLSKRIFASQKISENVVSFFEKAQALLDDIASGELPLMDSDGALVATSNTNMEVWTNNQGYNPTFHEGEWRDMVQDPDKLQDISDDRA